MITALILTFNEEPNIERTLQALDWVNEIVVVDSGSTDKTLAILARYPSVRVVYRPFDHHSSQCNFGISHCKTPWILALDADYVLSPELVAELKQWKPEPGIVAWFAAFQYVIAGCRLHGTLYPPRPVLFDPKACKYTQDGHAQRLLMNGESRDLRNRILHDDRKSLERWTSEQMRYARREAEKLLHESRSELRLADRVRSWIVVAPFLVLVYTFVVKGVWRDGFAGLFYCFQRMFAELLLSLCLLESRLGVRGTPK